MILHRCFLLGRCLSRRGLRVRHRLPLGRCLLLAVSLSVASAGAFAASVVDPTLRVQTWVRGLQAPTGAAFIDDGATALVLEKNTGRVQIVQGRAITGTALDLPVANNSERGLLGIAIDPNFAAASPFVYLHYTAAARDGGEAIDHRVERYRWESGALTFDRRLLTMPGGPGPNHDGGKLVFGPDGKLYATIGDLNRPELTSNFEASAEVNRSGAILRVNPSGSNARGNPFAVRNEKSPLNDIWAYGIRNSYGIAFDPVTGNLWDTENGPDRMDEINRVGRGFNSGWRDVMGPSDRDPGGVGTLATLGPAAHYEEPKLSWEAPVAPTDAFFMETARLGRELKHDLFVGTVLGDGVIYKFDLSPSRRTLGLVDGPLADGVADNSSGRLLDEQDEILWGTDFGVVSDLLSGPGGMYVTSLSNGVMYRITTRPDPGLAAIPAVPEPSFALAALLGAAAVRRRPRLRAVHPPLAAG